MDTTAQIQESQDKRVFVAMIDLLTGHGIDSAVLQSLERHTTASARHALWEGPDDEDLEDTPRRRRALRH